MNLEDKFKLIDSLNCAWLINFPRSGSTWLLYMLSCISNNVFIDRLRFANLIPDTNQLRLWESTDIIKFHIIRSHWCFSDRYKNKKIVYLYRDGRDVALSAYYHFDKKITFSEYLKNDFIKFEQLNGKPGRRYGANWKEHVEAWAFKKDEKILVVKYEDLYQNTFQITKNIVEFIEIKTTNNWIKDVTRIVNYEYFKKISTIANVRLRHVGIEGKPGSWKENFSQPDLTFFWNWAGELMEQLEYEA